MRRPLAILLVGAALLASAPAFADTAEAMKAFDEGRKLRDARDFEKAAAAFERSISIERSIGAYYNLGFSFEQLGRTRDALDAYKKAAALAHDKGDAREKEASGARDRLLDTHSYVMLRVSDDVVTTPGMRIVVDGELVPRTHYNGEVFRSGSQHEIVISAPGRKDLRLQARNKEAVAVVLGEPLPAVNAPPPPPPPITPVPETSSGGWGWQTWMGLGLIGVGAIGVIYATVRGISYASEESSLDEKRRNAVRDCRAIPDTTQITSCDAANGVPGSTRVMAANAAIADYEANERDARDSRPLWIGVGVAGLALVGGGVALMVIAPKSTETVRTHAASVRVVPRVGARESGLFVVGSF